MPFSTEVVTRTVIIHTCKQCQIHKEFQSLSYGEVVTCNGCQTNESFTGKQDVRYDIHGNQEGKFKKALNNPWVVSIITGLLVVLLVSGVIYLTMHNATKTPPPSPSQSENNTTKGN